MSSASAGSGTRLRMKLRRRLRSSTTISEIRRSCSVIAAVLTGLSIPLMKTDEGRGYFRDLCGSELVAIEGRGAGLPAGRRRYKWGGTVGWLFVGLGGWMCCRTGQTQG